ncbi:hypothetical protein DSL64_08765 [Dyadobacter luteus]|uniref:Uncharacterized protein n=2 Tax=Dyadobacter luteus TaxID=2259619 RepID=A0A3D8YD14_9BACT|nr:hypothetical protein DSL64_08765 [Dyadobacter luteus]
MNLTVTSIHLISSLAMKLTCTSLLVLFVSLILSCANPNESSDKPFISKVSFAGISEQNVSFNAAKAQIIVKIPPVLKDGLRPVFELSEGAEIVDGLTEENTIDLTSLCGCTYNPAKITLRLDNKKALAIYEIIVIPEGPLKAQDTDEPIAFTRKGEWVELSLPVENLYTNPKVTMLSFRNVATGQEEHVSADAACLNRCSGTEHDRVIFTLTNPIQTVLKPGNTYKVSFNNIEFPQPLVVTE